MKFVEVALCALIVLAVTTTVHAEETRLPGTADGLNAAVQQMVNAVQLEQDAMSATMAAHDGPTRRLTQATAAPTGGVAAAAAAAAAAPTSMLQAKASLEAELAQYCTPSSFTPAAKKPAMWTGQGFTLALIPHSCLIYPETKTLACTPAQIVLLNTPAKWNQAYTAPAGYTGKSCQLVQPLGKSSTQVLGAAPYTVPIPVVADPLITTPDFHHMFGASTRPAASAAVAAAGK